MAEYPNLNQQKIVSELTDNPVFPSTNAGSGSIGEQRASATSGRAVDVGGGPVDGGHDDGADVPPCQVRLEAESERLAGRGCNESAVLNGRIQVSSYLLGQRFCFVLKLSLQSGEGEQKKEGKQISKQTAQNL